MVLLFIAHVKSCNAIPRPSGSIFFLQSPPAHAGNRPEITSHQKIKCIYKIFLLVMKAIASFLNKQFIAVIFFLACFGYIGGKS